jgi:hypothetical protein
VLFDFLRTHKRWFNEDRLVAVLIAVGTLLYTAALQELRGVPTDDVLGAVGYPTLLALGMFGLSAYLFARPPKVVESQSLKSSVWIHWGIFLLYTLLLPILGFIAGTLFFLAALFFLMGGSLKQSIIMAAISAILMVLLFEKGLDITLPAGFWR